MKEVKFMTVKEKEMVLKQWKSFIKEGCKQKRFTTCLYHHLIQHCSFIAHYNRDGFYSTYFHNPEDEIRFFKQFDKDFGHLSIEYGGRYWLTNPDYNDINQAMCDTIEPYKTQLYAKNKVAEKERDLAFAASLLRKHGISCENFDR